MWFLKLLRGMVCTCLKRTCYLSWYATVWARYSVFSSAGLRDIDANELSKEWHRQVLWIVSHIGIVSPPTSLSFACPQRISTHNDSYLICFIFRQISHNKTRVILGEHETHKSIEPTSLRCCIDGSTDIKHFHCRFCVRTEGQVRVWQYFLLFQW